MGPLLIHSRVFFLFFCPAHLILYSHFRGISICPWNFSRCLLSVVRWTLVVNRLSHFVQFWCIISLVRPASCVLYLASCVLHPVSCVLRPRLCTLRQALCVRCLLEDTSLFIGGAVVLVCMCVWGCGYWCSSGTSRKHVSMGGGLYSITLRGVRGV